MSHQTRRVQRQPSGLPFEHNDETRRQFRNGKSFDPCAHHFAKQFEHELTPKLTQNIPEHAHCVGFSSESLRAAPHRRTREPRSAPSRNQHHSSNLWDNQHQPLQSCSNASSAPLPSSLASDRTRQVHSTTITHRKHRAKFKHKRKELFDWRSCSLPFSHRWLGKNLKKPLDLLLSVDTWFEREQLQQQRETSIDVCLIQFLTLCETNLHFIATSFKRECCWNVPRCPTDITQWSVQDLVHTAVSFMCETLGLNQVTESAFRQN